MPIQNIQGLVDKNGLSYINNGNFIDQYYNEALANLGQRNTNDSLLESITFTIKDIFSNLNNYVSTTDNPNPNNPYLYVIYCNSSNDSNERGVFYTLNEQQIKEYYGINDIYNHLDINCLQDIIAKIQSCRSFANENFIIPLKTIINSNNTSDNSYII